jgi:hypothetical protein
VSRIAEIIYAAKVDPDQYREEHGRCPRGYRWRDGKCQPMGKGNDTEQPDESAPTTEPGGEVTEKPKAKPKKKNTGVEVRRQRVARKKAEQELADLFDSDIERYMERADELRAQGVLPSRDAAEKLAEIDDWKDLPERVIRNPEALQKIVNQQAAQRAHEERMVERKVKYLDDFMFKRELAEERGEKPPRLSLVKMARDLDKEMGRPVGKNFAKSVNKLSKTLRSGKAASDPGSWAQKLKEIMEGLVLPKWRHRIQGSVEGSLADPRAQDLWNLGFPPYAAPKPRVVLPTTRNRGFPPFGPEQDGGAVRQEHLLADDLDIGDTNRAPVMRGFPPYDKPEDPRDSETVGLPPYNGKPPRSRSYIPDKVPRPGFPPYTRGPYRVEVDR